MMEVAVPSKKSAALEEETVTRTVNVFLALYVEETTAKSSIQQHSLERQRSLHRTWELTPHVTIPCVSRDKFELKSCCYGVEMTRSAMSGGPGGPMDGAFQLPNIGSSMAAKGSP